MNERLIAAARAVVQRWSSIDWKSATHTAVLIHELGAAADALAAQPASEPVAWMNPETLDVIHSERKQAWERDFGDGSKKMAAKYSKPLYAAQPARAGGDALLSDDMLEVGRKAIEDALIECRDARISVLARNNGLVVKERDGKPSDTIRMGPEVALGIGIRAMLAALAAAPQPAAAEQAPQQEATHWLVMAPCGEGVVFDNKRDAQWALTGEGVGSDGLGVPVIGEAFRDAYEGETLTLVPLTVGDSRAASTQVEQPAASTVPARWVSEQYGGEFDEMTAGQGYRKGWNDCRDAMLAAAPAAVEREAQPLPQKVQHLVDTASKWATMSREQDNLIGSGGVPSHRDKVLLWERQESMHLAALDLLYGIGSSKEGGAA